MDDANLRALEQRIQTLEQRVEDLSTWKSEEVVKDKIVVVAPVDASYNIPVLANGQRRKISTSAA